MSPLVSVIIPVYNGSGYLLEAIDSVLSQTYRYYEIMVVDDGSTDDTAALLQPYLRQNSEQIRYVYQANQGVGAARNHGIRQARGSWIAFLDQDDVWLPEKLALQTNQAQLKPQSGIIHSGWQIIDAQGNVRSTVQPWQGLPELTLSAWICWKPIFLGAMLFRQDWLSQVGGFDATWQQTGDVELGLRLAALGCPAVWVQQATVQYRQHPANTSRNVQEQIGELSAMLDRFFAEVMSPAVCRLEPQSRYQSWVWGAWRLYQSGYGYEMAQCLEKSLNYTHQPFTSVICDWIKQFGRYSAEYGLVMNVADLIQTPGWQQVIRTRRSCHVSVSQSRIKNSLPKNRAVTNCPANNTPKI